MGGKEDFSQQVVAMGVGMDVGMDNNPGSWGRKLQWVQTAVNLL